MRDLDPHNDLTFFRVRGKNKQEILVAPDKHLFLIVIQKTEFDEQWFAKIGILLNEFGLQTVEMPDRWVLLFQIFI